MDGAIEAGERVAAEVRAGLLEAAALDVTGNVPHMIRIAVGVVGPSLVLYLGDLASLGAPLGLSFALADFDSSLESPSSRSPGFMLSGSSNFPISDAC